MVTAIVQQRKAQICQCTWWICPYVPMPTQENVWSTSTHLPRALKLLKGLTVANVLAHSLRFPWCFTRGKA